MRRYWIDAAAIASDIVMIDGEVFHHICGVCRQTVGDRFEILGKKDVALLVELVEVAKKHARAKILEQRAIKPLAEPHIHLALSFPRPAVFDSVLERAVELGVSSIAPFFSEHSYFRSQAELDRLQKKSDRWQKIIVSATQQSGRSQLLKLHPLQPNLQKMFEQVNLLHDAAGLFAFEGAGELSIKQALQEIKPLAARNIWLFVGSEGGFSAREVEVFKKRGLKPVTLGDQVLRVETACLALISVIKYDYNLMG